MWELGFGRGKRWKGVEMKKEDGKGDGRGRTEETLGCFELPFDF